MPVRLDSASKRAAARVGSVVKDKWTLDRLIGVGGMAAVYAATHRNKKRAAIKMLHPELSLDTVMRDRFLREGYVSNSVGHHGAVRVDDDDVAEDGCAYIVMELLDGETLEQRWERKNHRLPAPEVLSLIDQLLDTLTQAHAKGIVHRDIKPENLFLTRDGVVKVLDFGIARLHELTGQTSSTQTGNTMGTPAFMAPEQARAKWEDVDARTDLWAVGATMFTLLTGEFVHEGDTVNETLAMAVTQRARSLGALRPDLHPALISLVDRALRYDKASRWPDAVTMQEALRYVYLEMQGVDVKGAPSISVPENPQPLPPVETTAEHDSAALAAMVPPSSSPQAAVDPRALTTARGVTASGQPTMQRSVLRRRVVIAVGVAAALLALIVIWSMGDDEAPVAAGSPPSAQPPETLASATPEPAPSADQPLPVPVKLEELPKEPKKGSGSRPLKRSPTVTAPAKRQNDDPFARRR